MALDGKTAVLSGFAELFLSARVEDWTRRVPFRENFNGNRCACGHDRGRTVGVSWAAVAAGAVGAAALALLLIAFGAGLGLSAVSPWSDSGVSASTFKTGTGIYLVIVAVMSSGVGGYLAARLRTKWAGVNTHEVFFRDTAHGFLAWAFATLLSATALSSATAYLANGTAAGVGGAASQATGSGNPADIYVDKLFRASSAAQPVPASLPNSATPNNANPNQSRAEVVRLWTSDFHETYDLSAADRTMLRRSWLHAPA